jgi:hypothetical protein
VVPGTVDGLNWTPRVILSPRTTGISPRLPCRRAHPKTPGLELEWNAGVNPCLLPFSPIPPCHHKILRGRRRCVQSWCVRTRFHRGLDIGRGVSRPNPIQSRCHFAEIVLRFGGKGESFPLLLCMFGSRYIWEKNRVVPLKIR